MSYMLIELSTGNVLAFFPTEREALQEVAESIREDGIDSVGTLGLGYNDPAGPVRRIADGPDLAERALRAPGARPAVARSSGGGAGGAHHRPRGGVRLAAAAYRNTKGQTYYLHGKEVTLQNGRRQRIYYFAREEKRGEGVDRIPPGYCVAENDRTGLPFLKKA